MSDKKYFLANGQQLDTEAELKAYIRGLELARDTVLAGGSVSDLLDDAHSVKAAGPKSEAQHNADQDEEVDEDDEDEEEGDESEDTDVTSEADDGDEEEGDDEEQPAKAAA